MAKLKNVKVGKTDIKAELKEAAKKWDSGEYHGFIMCGVKKDLEGEIEAHLVVIPGDLNRFEVMGAAADLAHQINAQKI